MDILTQPPRPHSDNIVQIADFSELECFKRADNNVSLMDIARILQRDNTEADDEGGEDEDIGVDDKVKRIVAEAFEELDERKLACGWNGEHYPFEVAKNGTLLQLKPRTARERRHFMPYFYLLLATRLNMQTERQQGGEDGTALFEDMCSEVATQFWGGSSASVRSLVFGTARLQDDLDDHSEINKRNFKNAINHLCQELGEGTKYAEDRAPKPTAMDGKLDVVVWRSFADKRHGRLIGFGQCKTGTHWDRDLGKLRPVDFSKKWLHQHYAVDPVRLYFITDRAKLRWYDRCVDGGILFDRCRVLEYATELSASVRARIESWTKAALTVKELV